VSNTVEAYVSEQLSSRDTIIQECPSRRFVTEARAM
jgi:hypothetical protein